MIKWAVNRNEFDIRYWPHIAVKGQALADFITKNTSSMQELKATPTEEEWWLFAFCSSTNRTAGVGCTLIPPDGEPITYGLELSHNATNNEPEYEVVIIGLLITRKAGACHLSVRCGSELVVRQLNGDYKAKEEKMARYVNKVRALMNDFDKVTLT